MTAAQIEDMYHIMAIANFEDRFVIPTTHREVGEDAYDIRGKLRLQFRQWLFGRVATRAICSAASGRKIGRDADGGDVMSRSLKCLSVLLSYPTEETGRSGCRISVRS